MHVLVTGATGFIGRHLVDALLARGCRVRAVSRNAQLARSMSWFDDVEFIAADIHGPDLDIVALTKGVDAMTHLAWTGLRDCAGLFHFEQTLFADYAFIKHVVEAGVGQVLVTGTCFEYGQQSGPLDEEAVALPSNAYGLAKNTLRLFLQSLQREQPFILQWARLFYLYGAGQNDSSLLASLDRAIDAGEPSFNMSAGEQLRDYLPVEVAADSLAELLHRRDFSGVINCSSGRPISVRTLVEQRVQARDSSMTLNLGHYPYSALEPMAFWGVADRLQQLLAPPFSERYSDRNDDQDC